MGRVHELVDGVEGGGGDLAGAFVALANDGSEVNFVWHAVQGQIYPELARLAAEGLIRQTSTGPCGAKRFEATDDGIAELRRWIMTSTANNWRPSKASPQRADP
jgi:DNA-binding PadR family transcriptional regulator